MKVTVSLLAAAGLLAACSPSQPPAHRATAPQAPQAPAPPPITAPAGEYVVDKAHTSVNFRVSHLGFSHFTARFTKIDGKLHFDPANPTAQTVEAVIDARSLQTNYQGPPKLDFDSEVENQFLHVDQHPQITFKSTKVEMTGPRAAKVTGDFTLNGVTKPLTLDVTFNGGWGPQPMDNNRARVGFSGRTTFKRSDFGVSYGLPPPGTTMGVGDDVEVIIETEFVTPPQPAAK